MRNTLLLLLTASALLLSACAPSDEEDSGGTTDNTTIYSYSVKGTDGAVSGGTVTPDISPYVNGGVFEVSWDVSAATRPHRIELYVSRDQTLDSADKMFLGRNCDQSFGDCQTQANTFRCAFSTSNVIQCGTSGADAYNMTSYFSSNGGLPNAYYIILRACDGLFDDCRTRSAAVVFE
jgi:hypothetical protein